MKNIALSTLAAVVLASSLAHAGTINIVLDSSTLSGAPGAVLSFSGVLTNTTGAPVFLNADDYNLGTLPSSAWDDSPFWTNAPVSLAASANSGDIGLFNIDLPGAIATGLYNGSFTILGGAAADSQDILGSVNFTVDVTSQQSGGGAPEPATGWLAAAAVVALLMWGRRSCLPLPFRRRRAV